MAESGRLANEHLLKPCIAHGARKFLTTRGPATNGHSYDKQAFLLSL